VSSLKPNLSTWNVPTAGSPKAVEAVDFPGHSRLRMLAHSRLALARCVVYMLDSQDRAGLKEAAEHMYELFTHKDVVRRRISILIVCNKADAPMAKAPRDVAAFLEREIERMRKSRGAVLAGQDEAASYLGIEGQPFKLEHAPCSVTVVPASLTNNQTGEIVKFLSSEFVS